MGMKSKDKIMLQCFREVKCEQGFTTGIQYKGYNVLGELEWVYISGLMDNKLKNQIVSRRTGENGFVFRF